MHPFKLKGCTVSHVKVQILKWIMSIQKRSSTIGLLSPIKILQEPLNLPGRKTRSKISKRHFFQDIKKSFHGVTQMGPKPHQIFFFEKISQQIWSLDVLEVLTN